MMLASQIKKEINMQVKMMVPKQIFKLQATNK